MAKKTPSKKDIVAKPKGEMEKQYLKTKDVCKVTFRLPANADRYERTPYGDADNSVVAV